MLLHYYFFLDINYVTTHQVNDSSELNAIEITKLANKIRLLQAHIAKLDNQRITDDTVVGLTGFTAKSL